MASTQVVVSEQTGATILVVSPVAAFRKKIRDTVAPRGRDVGEVAGGAEALIRLEAEDFRTLFLDRQLEDLEFQELIGTIRARFPRLQVVTVDSAMRESSAETELAESATEDARAAENETVKIAKENGATSESNAPTNDFLLREIDRQAAAANYTTDLHAPARKPLALPGMIGECARMRQLYRLANLVAPRDTTVLVVGATGTGKELVARGIHALSPRAERAFVVVNCAAIPETLLEAELFGYTRGAFTGAFQSRIGRIHAAHEGTLLLDEVGELPLSMQAKLLRFVQEGEVQRLGSSDVFRVDVRLIAATNANLLQRVKERTFREDLYYRLAVFPLELPPLRQRGEDILPLAQNYLDTLCREAGMAAKRLSSGAMQFLRQHPWPGNVRELHHLVERAFVLSEDDTVILPEHLMVVAEMV